MSVARDLSIVIEISVHLNLLDKDLLHIWYFLEVQNATCQIIEEKLNRLFMHGLLNFCSAVYSLIFLSSLFSCGSFFVVSDMSDMGRERVKVITMSGYLAISTKLSRFLWEIICYLWWILSPLFVHCIFRNDSIKNLSRLSVQSLIPHTSPR